MHTFAPAVTGIDSASIAVIAVLSLMVAFSIHTGVDSARIAVIAVLLAMSAFSIHTRVGSARIAVIAVLLPMSTCPVLAGVGGASIAIIAISWGVTWGVNAFVSIPCIDGTSVAVIAFL